MRAFATVAFFGGLLLAVRVMFFGVEKRIDDEHLAHRRWPLALAAFLVVAGALLYARSKIDPSGVTPRWFAMVVILGVGAGVGAWWMVTRSAAIPSSDPDDDPRYRFQGHVARVIEPIVAGAGDDRRGRIGFIFDGKPYEFRACWSPGGAWDIERSGLAGSEVVIERVEEDVAYVEPWTVVEERL